MGHVFSHVKTSACAVAFAGNSHISTQTKNTHVADQRPWRSKVQAKDWLDRKQLMEEVQKAVQELKFQAFSVSSFILCLAWPGAFCGTWRWVLQGSLPWSTFVLASGWHSLWVTWKVLTSSGGEEWLKVPGMVHLANAILEELSGKKGN